MSLVLNSLSAAQLRRAAEIKEEIDSLQNELSRLVGSSTATPIVKPRRRRMSAAGRLAIAAAQKARWAKLKAKA